MLINYARFKKISLLFDFLPPANQSKDRSRTRTQNKDYPNHAADPECIHYEIRS